MAKIDELTEVIVNEFETFKEASIGIKKSIEEIKNIEIEANTKELETTIKDYFKEHRKLIHEQSIEIDRLSRRLKNASTLPNWLRALSSISLLIIVFTFCYLAHVFITLDKQKEQAYENGKEAIHEVIREYYNAYPKEYEKLQEWAKEEDEK